MSQAMTDKQIACAYLSQRLSGIIPDHDDLRGIADAKLSEDRCYRISQRIIELCNKAREPLVQHLNNTGCDTI